MTWQSPADAPLELLWSRLDLLEQYEAELQVRAEDEPITFPPPARGELGKRRKALESALSRLHSSAAAAGLHTDAEALAGATWAWVEAEANWLDSNRPACERDAEVSQLARTSSEAAARLLPCEPGMQERIECVRAAADALLGWRLFPCVRGSACIAERVNVVSAAEGTLPDGKLASDDAVAATTGLKPAQVKAARKQKAARYGTGKETQAQLAARFGGGNETQAQLDGRFGGGKETQAQLASQHKMQAFSIARLGDQQETWLLCTELRTAAAFLKASGATQSLQSLECQLAGYKSYKKQREEAERATPGSEAACREVAGGAWLVENASRLGAKPLTSSTQFLEVKAQVEVIWAAAAADAKANKDAFNKRKRDASPKAKPKKQKR